MIAFFRPQARELVGLDLASGVPTGSSEAATREVLALASRSREEREQSRRRGLEWLRSVTFTHTLEAVLAWISKGAPRWTPIREEGFVDRWASLPADPEHLFGRPGKSKRRFGLL